MNKIEFTDKNGTFRIHNPENYSGLYLPLAGETNPVSRQISEETARQIRIIFC